MSKGLRLYIMAVVILSLTACSSPKAVEIPVDKPLEESQDIITIATKEEQEVIMNEFYKLLSGTKDKDELISFADENIKRLDADNVDTIIIGLEEFLAIGVSPLDVDYNLLNKYRENTSDELKSYLDIMALEVNDVFSDGEGIKTDLPEILNRALSSEKHIDSFPGSRTVKRVQDLYTAYIEGAILGAGNQYIYAEEGSSTIKKDVLHIYKSVVENNKDTKTANILSQYIEVLEANNNDMNSAYVNAFYEDIYEITRSIINR